MTDCHACATPVPTGARFCNACGADVTDPGATMIVRPHDPTAELQERLTRTLAGRYQVRKLLGAGGMAAVFLADEIGLDRPVAIKVLPPELARDEGLVTRFQREAKTSAKLDHPHIIPIYRVESEAGLHYFVMKYVPGRSLESLLENKEAMAIDLTTRILSEAAMALGHAHSRGVVHRDVKPANIMLDQDGRVVLTDFGISKAGETSSLTQTGTIVGTPHYMAPEQALGTEVDGRADQYALGIVAYQILARQCPFTGGSAHTILYRHIHETPTPIAELRPNTPSHLADAVAIAMAKDPANRFATMEEFARALNGEVTATTRRLASVSSTTGTRSAFARAATQRIDASPAARPQRTRRTAIRVAAGLAIVAVVAAGGWAAKVGRDRSGIVLDSAGTLVKSNAVSDSGARAAASTRQRQRQSSEQARKQTSPITVASEPYGVLFIDDIEIGDTPVANHPLEVGRSYRIRVEREGFRTKRETITVGSPNPIRRSYVLDPGGAP
jgi:serine/threonine protein kinase